MRGPETDQPGTGRAGMGSPSHGGTGAAPRAASGSPAGGGAAPSRAPKGWLADALDLLPPTLDVVAEAAWLAIVYLVLQVLGAHGPVLLGPIQFAALAAIGLAVARGALPWSGRGVLAATAAIAGLAGWLLSPAARDAVLAGRIDVALSLHAGGWLAGLAVVRGAAHADPGDDDLVLARLLAWGLPALVVPWLLSQVVGPAARAAFVEPAFVATLTFVVSVLLAIAVARLDALGSRSGVNWRSNPAWLLVLALIVAATVLVGLPLALVLGVPLDAAIRGALGPLWLLVVAVVAVIAIPAGLLATGLVLVLRVLLGPSHALPAAAASAIHGFHPEPATGLPGPVYAIAILAVVVAALAFLAWQLLPTFTGRRDASLDEERQIVLPGAIVRPGLPLPRLRPRRQPIAPRDAATAYVAAVEDLRAVPELARGTDETPTSHVRRLRAAGRGLVPLELLAADYALARYAGRALSVAEDRRGLARWRRLRAVAKRHGVAGPPETGRPGAGQPPGAGEPSDAGAWSAGAGCAAGERRDGAQPPHAGAPQP